MGRWLSLVVFAACAPLARQPDELDAGVVALDAGADPCPPENPTYCPGVGLHFCRLNLIRLELATGCTADAECVLAPRVLDQRNCRGYRACGFIPVLATKEAEWESRSLAEMGRFCASAPPCGFAADCFGMVPAARAVCLDGGCSAVITP